MKDKVIAIESPGGEIHYCTRLNETNPYISSINIDNLKETQELDNNNYSNNYNNDSYNYYEPNIIILNESYYNNAISFQKKAFIVKIITIFDFINHFYLFFFQNITISSIIMLISLNAHISIYSYNKFIFSIYLFYYYLNTINNIIHFYSYIYISNNSKLQYSLINHYNISLNYFNNEEYALLLCFSALIQIMLNYYLQSFYNLFPLTNVNNRINRNTINNIGNINNV